ncbi:hypothetical protein [Sodalis sp. RH16]|uniref:hypothetical protein n=1 Tax=Sodalis sp. RH16 TaxID=3394331 RepID=UPI0039B59BEE
MNNTLSANNGTVTFSGYASMDGLGAGANTHEPFSANTSRMAPRISVSNSSVKFNKIPAASRDSAQLPPSIHGGSWTGGSEITAGLPQSIMGGQKNCNLHAHCSVHTIGDSLNAKASNQYRQMPYRSSYAAITARKKWEKEIYYQNIKKACLDEVTNKHLSIYSVVKKYGVPRTRLMKWLKECPAWTGNLDDGGLSAELLHKRILEVNSSLIAAQQSNNGPAEKAAGTHRSAQGKSSTNSGRAGSRPLPVLQQQAANGDMAQMGRLWRPW